jgi:sRNA-binding protein
MTENEHAAHALKQAQRAAKKGDLANAERWSKAAERMASAAGHLKQAAPPPDDNEKERRAELRRRFARMVDVKHDVRAWEEERDHYYAQLASACENGTEPPPQLRPHPCGPLGDDDYLRRLAESGEG